MVEIGLNDIEIEQNSPNDVVQLRSQLRELEQERDHLHERLQAIQRQQHHIGMGRIKELIIKNPGISRTEIFNHIAKYPQEYARKSLDRLESSDFTVQNNQWYPPDEVME